MIKPKSNSIIHGFFSWYISRIISRDFHAFEFNEEVFLKDEAILLLANHSSWWDGFLLFQLNKLYFKKNFHVMILQDTAEKVKFLKYLGAFSVQKNSRSLMESLEYAGELLDDPANLVLIFPQGELHSSYVSEINFEKGVGRMISFSKKKFQLMFAAVLTDYFDQRRPTVNIHLEKWNASSYSSLQVLKSAFNKHYERALKKQSEVKV